MAIPDNYGRLWGQIPNTAGQVFWVSPSASYTVNGRAHSASDNNDGLTPDRALRTVARAWALCTASAGDVIVLLPGTHSPSASIAASKAGVTMMGLPSGKGNFLAQKTTIAAVTGDQNINVTAADIEIAFLNIDPITADSALDATAAADRLHIHHCAFQLTDTVNTGTIGIDFIGGASDVIIEDCLFLSDGAQGPAIVGGACLTILIQNCIFLLTTGTWAVVVSQAAAGRRMIVRQCAFNATVGTITAGVDGTTSGEVDQLYFAYNSESVGVTKVVDGYDGGDAVLIQNYVGTLGGGDGGASLVTATT